MHTLKQSLRTKRPACVADSTSNFNLQTAKRFSKPVLDLIEDMENSDNFDLLIRLIDAEAQSGAVLRINNGRKSLKHNFRLFCIVI